MSGGTTERTPETLATHRHFSIGRDGLIHYFETFRDASNFAHENGSVWGLHSDRTEEELRESVKRAEEP